MILYEHVAKCREPFLTSVELDNQKAACRVRLLSACC